MVSIVTAAASSCGDETGDREDELIIFHAGSLSVPLKRIAEDFMDENPGVRVLLEAAGSRSCARKISDLGRPCDVMASADYTVIDELLVPRHADWNIRFASNEMALVYHEGSRRAEEMNSENWFEVLLDPGVAFGRSDPDSDPCGYRAVLTMKLAEVFYGEEDLAGKLMSKDTRYIRPKETDLLALLEAGTIDYIFLYRSVAKQHGLPFLILPDEINLKSPEHSDFYSLAEVEVSGKVPGTSMVKRGAPIVYGVTIPKNSPDPVLAEKFLRHLLSPSRGMAVMDELGQPSIVPTFSDSYDRIPASLKEFARDE